MAPEDASAECFVCRKHRERGALVPGGPVGEDALAIVSHLTSAAPGSSGAPVYLGHLFVEPKRHAPGLGDLTDAEAQAVGWWCARVSRALREVAGAEHVYAAVIGDQVPHLHVHLMARYPGTPGEYWWNNLAQWPDAPRGSEPRIASLVRDLRAYLSEASGTGSPDG
jgi:histidine triad (HIT) family protein